VSHALTLKNRIDIPAATIAKPRTSITRRGGFGAAMSSLNTTVTSVRMTVPITRALSTKIASTG
jgi:hypothetical protein